jgi:hypothetical protein
VTRDRISYGRRAAALVAAAFASAPGYAATPGTGPAPPTRNLCPVPSDAYLRARLAGSLEQSVNWRAGAMECEGMQRPDGRGLRVTFRGQLAGERVTFVFGVPRLEEGRSANDAPVNVTVIREGHGVYGTRGEDKCTLDDVRQSALAPEGLVRRWRIEARGFCLEPARAVGAGNGAILLSTFDFAGYLSWEPDPPAPAPGPPPVAPAAAPR